jgi:hypothetical protein
MLVFLDDSGDPGFKIEKGASSHFVIAMVIFDDPLEAEKAAVAIKTLRRELGFPDGTEFKFYKSRDDVRKRFLRAVMPFNFKVRCLVVDKAIIRSTELRTDKKSFYAYFIKLALQYSGSDIGLARVRIDGSGDRTFRRTFLTYLRREVNPTTGDPKITDIRLEDSKQNVLIQMADMVAGSILRKYARDEDEYYDIIRDKISDDWSFR